MVLAIGGNAAMILIYCRVKELRDINNTAITFLSSSDFIRGSIIMTTKVHSQLHFVRQLGGFWCTLTAIICGFTFVFSPMTLALIGVVRYCKVVPRTANNFDLSWRKFYAMILTVFLVALFFALLPDLRITGQYTYSPSHGVCFAVWHPENEIFRSIFYILVIGLAFPVLTICYILLFRALRTHNKNITEYSTHGSQVKKSANPEHSDDGSQVKRSEDQNADCYVIENPHPFVGDKRDNETNIDDLKSDAQQSDGTVQWKSRTPCIMKLSFSTPTNIFHKSKVS